MLMNVTNHSRPRGHVTMFVGVAVDGLEQQQQQKQQLIIVCVSSSPV